MNSISHLSEPTTTRNVVVLKRIITSITLLTLFSSAVWAQYWYRMAPIEHNGYLYDLSFVNDSTGWAVGNEVLYTNNGGLTWNVQRPAVPSRVYNAVQFLDTQNGWAAGTNGIVSKTTDGGSLWMDINTGFTNPIHDICFTTTQKGHLVGNWGLIARTTDGGQTWNQYVTPIVDHLTSIDFVGTFKGWIVGFNGRMLRTTNGGVTWSETTLPNPIAYFYEVDFISETVGWACGVFYNSSSMGYGPMIRKTTDGGLIWSSPSSGLGVTITELAVINPNHVFTSGGFHLYKTVNGTNWTAIAPSLAYTITDIKFVTPQKGWISSWEYFSPRTRLLASVNGGVHWKQQYKGANFDFYDFTIIETTIYAVGEKGYIAASNLPTTSKWSIFPRIKKQTLRAIDSHRNQIWAVGDSGYFVTKFHEYSDWQVVLFPDATNLRSVDFVNSDTGWVAGEGGRIYHTTNQGRTWDQQISNTSRNINRIYFLNSQVGWCVGDDGVTLHTSNGGYQWNVQVHDLDANYDDLHSVYFFNEQKGWCVGEYGQVFQTTDGGSNWLQQVVQDTVDFNDVLFESELNGFIVGNRGTFYRTTNGGVRWYMDVQYDWLVAPPVSSLYRVKKMQNNAIYATGQNGSFWRQSNLSTTGEPTETVLPQSVQLQQNYPNPFNSQTMITYSLPHTLVVNLTLYDVQGRFVKSMIRGLTQSAGTYTATLDGAGLASGIYYIKLRAGEYVQTKKAVLLK